MCSVSFKCFGKSALGDRARYERAQTAHDLEGQFVQSTSKKNLKTNSSSVSRKKVRCALRDRREFECGIKYVNHSWVGRCGDDALFVTSWRLDVLALAQAKMGSRPKNLSRRF